MPNATDENSVPPIGANALVPLDHGFHLLRDVAEVPYHSVEFLDDLMRWFCLRLLDYRVGTNKWLFQRDGQGRAFAMAAHYLINELYAAVGKDRGLIVCPLPDSGYTTDRYRHVDTNMLASMIRAMEKQGDLRKAPGNQGGKWRRVGGRNRFLATEWVLSDALFGRIANVVCEDATKLPKLVMRTSWEALPEPAKDTFKDAWLAREKRNGRDGSAYDDVRTTVVDPSSDKKRTRKLRTVPKLTHLGLRRLPNDGELRQLWKAARKWYRPAYGRIMTMDEPGAVQMLDSLTRSNAFTALHCWRDGGGRVEPPSARVSHRVFYDERLNEHGRFYFSQQGKKKSILDGFTVNGEPTDTCDIVCTHPTAILNLAGRSIMDEPYCGDVYGYRARQELADPEQLRRSLLAAIGDRPVDAATLERLMTYDVLRLQWKRAYSIGLNARDREAAVNAIARCSENDPSKGHLCPADMLTQERDITDKPFWSRERVEHVVGELLVDPVFGPHICSKQGPRLMGRDAEWMERVRHRLEDAGIPYRDVHDSITGPVSRRDEIEAIMKQEWRALFGFDPAVKWNKWRQPDLARQGDDVDATCALLGLTDVVIPVPPPPPPMALRKFLKRLYGETP